MTPLSFSVENPQFVSKFPEGLDQLWRARVTATHMGEQHVSFDDVLFVESTGTAYIYGIEFEDGFIQGLRPAQLAQQQQAFIQFLRAQTRLTNETLGITALVFDGHEYACEHRATASYIAARNVPLGIGVGFHNRDGQYELIKLAFEEEV